MGRAASTSPPAVRGPEPESLPAPGPESPRPGPAPAPPPAPPPAAHVTSRVQTSRSADPARLRRHPGYKRATSRAVRCNRVAAAMQTPCLLLLLALGLLAAPAAALVR